MVARRALVRWALRLFRREWRQQVLVLALLTVAVAAATASVTVVDNTAPADDAEFGAANALLNLDGADPRKLEAGLAAARRSFGRIDVVAHRSVSVPGGVERVDYRAQDPAGAYGGPLLALRSGSYPTSPRQVAVTDGVAGLLRVEVGSTLALDGRRRTVVGIVENPRKLSDEFALVTPSSAGAPDYATVLVHASTGTIESFFGRRNNRPPALTSVEKRGDDHPEAKPVAMFSVATVFLLLASLIAAAGFAVVAQRRLRQLGMLAAIGATDRQLRLVLLANGAVVGAIAALLGTTLGLAGWVVVAPTLESAVDHRIDRLSLPWWLIATTLVLAILGATGAAWWPGRAAARLPIVLALSGRTPKPRPARHSAIAAAGLIAVGVTLLALSNRDRTPLIVAGIVATILGGLLVGPLAIRIFSGLAGRFSIAPRLALRDLARYQARSGAALAAVTLALGIAATVVIVASAEAAQTASEPPALSDRQVRVYLGAAGVAGELIPDDARARLPRLASGVGRLAAQLDRATVIPLRKVVQPGAPHTFVGDSRYVIPLELARRSGRLYRPDRQVYVATPEVLRYVGLDPATVDGSADFLVDRGARTDGLVVPNLTGHEPSVITNFHRIDLRRHLFGGDSGRNAPALATPSGLRRHGWSQIPAGWLVESRQPLTGDQISNARRVAADAGLTIEVQRAATSNAKIMALATTAGAVLALAILALTVGLIRSETAGDLRTLAAAGATPRIRRALTATTAGALALLGALLGVAGAYLVLSAMYHDDLGYLSHAPVVWLLLATVGLTLTATAAGWVLAGREPPTVARAVIE